MAGSRATIRSRQPDPRAATLTDRAHALGLDAVSWIDVADVVFFARDLDDGDRAVLEPVLADPLLQSITWDVPARGLETALHPGVTDAVADAVRHAAGTVGVDIGDAATGTNFTVDGDLDEAAVRLLARRLLANDVIEHWSPAPIAPAFVETTAAGTESAGTVTVTTLDAAGLAALNVARGLALDPAELDAIVAHYRAAGREPTEVELEMLAQTWSEHCAHKTFRATITVDDGTTRRRRCCASCATAPSASPRRSCAAPSSATPGSSRSPPARRWRSRPRRTTTRRPSSRSAGPTPASAGSSVT